MSRRGSLTFDDVLVHHKRIRVELQNWISLDGQGHDDAITHTKSRKATRRSRGSTTQPAVPGVLNNDSIRSDVGPGSDGIIGPLRPGGPHVRYSQAGEDEEEEPGLLEPNPPDNAKTKTKTKTNGKSRKMLSQFISSTADVEVSNTYTNHRGNKRWTELAETPAISVTAAKHSVHILAREAVHCHLANLNPSSTQSPAPPRTGRPSSSSGSGRVGRRVHPPSLGMDAVDSHRTQIPIAVMNSSNGQISKNPMVAFERGRMLSSSSPRALRQTLLSNKQRSVMKSSPSLVAKGVGSEGQGASIASMNPRAAAAVLSFCPVNAPTSSATAETLSQVAQPFVPPSKYGYLSSPTATRTRTRTGPGTGNAAGSPTTSPHEPLARPIGADAGGSGGASDEEAEAVWRPIAHAIVASMDLKENYFMYRLLLFAAMQVAIANPVVGLCVRAIEADFTHAC